MGAVRLDNLGIALASLAVMISIYLSTFEKGFIAVFPTILLVTGLTLMHFSVRRDEVEESDSGAGKVLLYALVGVVGILLVSWLAPKVVLPQDVSQLSFYDAKLFAVLMAVAEECFFRGFMLNLFYRWLNSGVGAVVVSSVIFAVFHTAVYGTSPNLMLYVFLAGTILGFIAVKTGRLSTSMLAHSIVNLISVM